MNHFDLKKRRKALGLTQIELGDIIGVDGGYVSQVELGKKRPSNRFWRIAEVELARLEQREVAKIAARGSGAVHFETGKDLANWRKEAGLTQQQLHQISEVSRNHIALIECGERLLSKEVREKLESAAEAYCRDCGCPGQGVAESIDSQPTIPVVDMAAVAHFDPLLSDLCDLWEGSKERIPCVCDNASKLFAIRIRGNAMTPKLQDGDVVVVRDTLPATGDICIVLHRTDGLLCKQWCWRNDVLRLEALNEEGKSYEWTKDEFIAEQPLVWRFKVDSLIFRKF